MSFTHYGKICKKKNQNSQHCKQSELHLFPKKRNSNGTFLIIFKHCENGLLPQCVDGRVEKKNYGKCRVDQKRLICSLFFQDLKRVISRNVDSQLRSITADCLRFGWSLCIFRVESMRLKCERDFFNWSLAVLEMHNSFENTVGHHFFLHSFSYQSALKLFWFFDAEEISRKVVCIFRVPVKNTNFMYL